MFGVRGKIGVFRWGLIAMAATACATTRGSDAQQQLAGKDWRLIELSGRAAVPSELSRRPSLRFAIDSGRVSGSGGCNRMSGPVTIDGDRIQFGALAATKMACADNALNRQEMEFFQALDDADRFAVSGDTLSLLNGAVVVARFAP
jgi:heat shock protein HslJ